MDGIERFIVENGESARSKSTDKQGTEETWGVGDGDVIDFVPIVGAGGRYEVSIRESLVDDGKDSLEVGTSGDFWDDATIRFENIDLRNDNIREKIFAILENCAGGFVARRFDCKNIHLYNYSILFIKLQGIYPQNFRE